MAHTRITPEKPPERGRQQLRRALRIITAASYILVESFVEDLLRFRIERFRMATIAGANQDHDSALDVSFVAALPKRHYFHAPSNTPFFAEFTNDGLVFRCHRPSPDPRPEGHFA